MTLAVWVLTALAALVVALTRLRLRRSAAGGGRAEIARGPVAVHTGAGTAALLAWVALLVAGDALGEDAATLLGLAGLLLWWVVVGAGLLLLTRWLPSRGSHATTATVRDSWVAGPWLSLLAHLGMLGGVAFFTYAYLVRAV